MRLRHVLAAIPLAVPLTSCCPNGETWHERDVKFTTPRTSAVATLLERCNTTQDCTPLCLDDWGHEGLGDYEVRGCEVSKNLVTGEYRMRYEGLETCEGGRRPAGYRGMSTRRAAATRTGAFLAQQAELEAASVQAFEELLADLVAHGAPRALRRACVAAAADEVRHARVCGRLARRHGGTVHLRSIPTAPRRSLQQLALDNAVEGCVRETYGAVAAGYQARAASDPAIRSAMTSIARDEARHAELSWRLHRWLTPRLSRAARAEIRARALAASAELRASGGTHDIELARTAGYPDDVAAHGMLDELDRTVWRTI